ncbi:hypothetical protein C2W59_00224 [Bacillus pumilus]|nr:hypothetical protein C2W59_00224 [Bacillus pumilus]
MKVVYLIDSNKNNCQTNSTVLKELILQDTGKTSLDILHKKACDVS